MWVLEKTSFIIVAPVEMEKALTCSAWKKQSQVACHALEKAKGTHALGKACGFWKRPLMALEKVDLGVDIAGLMQRHHEKCVKKRMLWDGDSEGCCLCF